MSTKESKSRELPFNPEEGEQSLQWMHEWYCHQSPPDRPHVSSVNINIDMTVYTDNWLMRSRKRSDCGQEYWSREAEDKSHPPPQWKGSKHDSISEAFQVEWKKVERSHPRKPKLNHMIRGLDLSVPSPNLHAGERGLRLSLVTSSQSIKPM